MKACCLGIVQPAALRSTKIGVIWHVQSPAGLRQLRAGISLERKMRVHLGITAAHMTAGIGMSGSTQEIAGRDGGREYDRHREHRHASYDRSRSHRDSGKSDERTTHRYSDQ